MERDPKNSLECNPSEEETNEQPTFCNLCQEFPEEYIALSCSHNFCLLCLTKLCFQNSNSRLVKTISPDEPIDKKPDEFQILCPIDNRPSPLNSSSIEALNKVKENFSELEQKKKPLYNEVIFEESAENFHTTDEFPKKKQQKIMNGPTNSELKILKNSFSSEEKDKFKYLDKNFQSTKEITENNSLSIPTPVKQIAEKNTTKKIDLSIVYCPLHENEEPIIVCFSCGNKPLCVECVVNGEHKNHEMVNISRIRESCKEALVNLEPEIEQKQKEFTAMIEKLSLSKKMVSDKIWEIKSRISKDINELKERLTNKENELLIAKDCEASEKFAEIDSYISGFEEKIGRLREFQRNLQIKSENSETYNEGVDLLNYFGMNKEEILYLLNSEVFKISDNLEDFKVEIDKESYMRYLEGLHNLHLTTSNLNDVDEKMGSSQKFFNPNAISKLNIEKSLLINDQFKERSPIEESRLRFYPSKLKEVNSAKLIESPLKSGHLTNSSFNLSFFNDNTKSKNLKWVNKSLGRANEAKYRYDLKENIGSKTCLGKYEGKYFTAVKKPKEKNRLISISRALDCQNKLFQKRKEVFYG